MAQRFQRVTNKEIVRAVKTLDQALFLQRTALDTLTDLIIKLAKTAGKDLGLCNGCRKAQVVPSGETSCPVCGSAEFKTLEELENENVAGADGPDAGGE